MELTTERQQYRRLIAELERREAETLPPPTSELLWELVSSFVRGDPLSATALLVPDGMVEDRSAYTFDLLLRFGDWYAKVLHDPAEEGFEFSEPGPGQDEQLSLFAAGSTSGVVTIPPGYAPDLNGGRNGGRALATIVSHPPEQDLVPRFMARMFPPAPSGIVYEVVLGVWSFACRDRLSGLAGVSRHVQFLREARQAYELLEGSRVDSLRAASELMTDPGPSHERIAALVPVMLWLPDRRTLRLSELLAGADRRVVEREISGIRQELARGSLIPPARVGEMSLAQVQRVCRNAGIFPESTSFQEEREIRTRIRGMGFGRDVDRLAASAIMALENGRIDLFWEAMEARVEGDISWSTLLDEAVSSTD